MAAVVKQIGAARTGQGNRLRHLRRALRVHPALPGGRFAVWHIQTCEGIMCAAGF